MLDLPQNGKPVVEGTMNYPKVEYFLQKEANKYFSTDHN